MDKKEESELFSLLTADYIKLGPRIHPLVNNYLEKEAKDKNKSKYDLIAEAIGNFLPERLSALIGKEKYQELFDNIKNRLLLDEHTEGALFNYINMEIISDDLVRVAKNMVELAFGNVGTVDRNSIMKLLYLKDSYIKELINDVITNEEIMGKYNISKEAIMNKITF